VERQELLNILHRVAQGCAMNQDRPIWEKLALIGSNRRLSLFTL